MKEKTIVLVTGGFDPLHSGHIHYFTDAKKLGDILVVGVNSDNWLRRKKGKAFMPNWERSLIIQNLKMVDMVITFNDDDDTANNAIWKVKQIFPQKKKIIFANGGDRNAHNIPEVGWPDVEFVFGVGGIDKINSSSKILENWTQNA
jgi:D-beta-D-heptose 7-phosphate kinase/D-beta-D-heptose 1-phosphate adenosyltransferase